MTQLLNPQLELAGMQSLLAITRSHLAALDDKLTSVPLDREDYLRTFGAASALRSLNEALEHTYRKTVNR